MSRLRMQENVADYPRPSVCSCAGGHSQGWPTYWSRVPSSSPLTSSRRRTPISLMNFVSCCQHHNCHYCPKSEFLISWNDSGWVLPCSGKEYSKGDSRYVARDTATVTVEGITAVLEGPASLLAVYVFSIPTSLHAACYKSSLVFCY